MKLRILKEKSGWNATAPCGETVGSSFLSSAFSIQFSSRTLTFSAQGRSIWWLWLVVRLERCELCVGMLEMT